ncbi:Protein ccc1 [Elasticomyces elasticus]|uniref:Protein ccc1 n=1 Tax=Exophiala sideris TaxID=1016849 RepID=A0ABR0J625_9EURO|nr:Protein ccc1 [Elasticomyces elasticus]KAK5028408.1 Protein ccc1 [Exophiala sideris]KAK5035949.1 Protein ccc1 [Exophiala sideris]KAK5056985.1 Protein ccc1 [Exophiala sideris]KAK5181392.1 Protein ccc1 [Eurotiomycetes sp. CCFEE 6388]
MEADQRLSMSPNQQHHERETLPTAPDLEANKPLLSRTSNLQARSDDQRVPVFWSDKSSTASERRCLSHLRLDARVVSDAILGLSDGLTVPFALTAGLTALGDTRLVILGGLAELVAGAISMGLGGYVGAKSEIESYNATDRSCNDLILQEADTARDYVQEYFEQFGLSTEDTKRVAGHIKASTPGLKEFLMQNHFHAAKPDTGRPYLSALTLGFSYFIGGFLPLIPYFIVPRDNVLAGLLWSMGFMCVVLLIFGYMKTGVVRGWTGKENYQACSGGALQMLVVGIIAAGAAVGLVRLINQT